MVDVVGTASAVLALVGTAETAVTTFRTFYRGVGVVETTISNFLREVQTLLSLIKAIKGMLDELPSTLQQDRELKVIWGPMEVSLRDCILAVEDLTRLFQRLNQSTGSWARNAVTQIRFQFQKPEIADLRERITSLQRNFDTAMGAMSFFLVLDRKLEPSKIENSLDNFVGKYDSQKYSLARRRETRIEGSNLSTTEIQEENMLKAAYSIMKSANETVDRLSTVGSNIDTQTEETETRDDVADWRERVLEAEVPSTVLEEEFMDSITWPEDTKRSQPFESISPDNITIRSNLLAEGITAYSRSNYVLANSCFRDAYETVGPINTMPLLDGQVSDDTMKAWLWLSEIRVNARKSKRDKAPVKSGLIAPNVNPAAIRIESRIQTCCDAVILSLAFMHRGDTAKAHDLCEAARVRIKELKGTACKEYSEALLALVEILYSKGSAPIAKSWRDVLLKDHMETLRKNARSFYLQDFPKRPSDTNDDLFVRRNRSNRVSANTLSEAQSVAKDRLCNAIEYGNFPAALFVINTFEVSLLKIGRLIDDYLVKSVKSDSASIVFLLIQLYPELERISGLGYQTARKAIDKAFSGAVSCDFSAAIELLIDAGANKDKSENRCLGDAREEPCYPPDPSTAMTPVLSHAISEGHRKAVNALLDKGAVLNGPLKVPGPYSSGSVYHNEPPLHVAIRRFEGRQIVPLLLERGADVNCAFRDVRPLALAIYHSGKPRDELSVSSTDERIVARSTVVELLIEKGADVNRRSLINGVRVTPLQQARKEGLTSIERLLLAKGAVERSEPRVLSRRQVPERTTRTRGERLGGFFGRWADD